MRRLARLIALALLAWLPLQAAALPGLVALCELDPAHSPMHHALHEDSAHDHGDHAHEHGGDGGAGSHDGGPGHGAGGHGCCHHYSTAAPSIAIAAPAAAHEVFVTASIHPHDFFPEQPKRPPLATL
ncbi:MAG TPA: hypothetical protein VLD36_05635 [Burkholderiales bacterium]|jgi:hypothetical protein|nr:hypothetical protein [Burkholderiales bacterium]